MQCRVTSTRILALRSMTKEEQVVEILEVEEEEQEMVEVKDQSLPIALDNKDTMQETVTNLP